MFDFTSPMKRKRVQAVLTKRVNQKCLEELSGGNRGIDRTSYVNALIVIPGSKRAWRFEEAFPVLSRDLSSAGMAILHSSALEGEVLVEVTGKDAFYSYVRCKVQHCNDLGYGYWQIGLKAEEIIGINRADHITLQERIAALTVEPLPEEAS